MAFPAGWGRKCKLTIQNGKVPGALSNFPVLLDLTTLPSEMFDADGSNPALSGGGDIRFSSDSDGNTQLSCEVVTFTIDNDPANGAAEIHVKVLSVASGTDTDFYIWYNKSGESQPAIDAAYGAESVWDSNYMMVQHMNEDPSGGSPQMIDSTSNNCDGTSEGTMTSGDLIDAQIGKGIDFDGDDDVVRLGSIDSSHALSLNGSAATISCIMNQSSGDAYQRIIDKSTAGSGANGYIITTNPTGAGALERSVGIFVAGSGDYTTTAYTFGTTAYITGVIDGVSSKIYIAGSLVKDLGLSAIPSATANMAIASWNHSTAREFKGFLDEIRISDIARSADWVGAEYNNHSDPATFIIEGAPASPGGDDLSISVHDCSDTNDLMC